MLYDLSTFNLLNDKLGISEKHILGYIHIVLRVDGACSVDEDAWLNGVRPKSSQLLGEVIRIKLHEFTLNLQTLL